MKWRTYCGATPPSDRIPAKLRVSHPLSFGSRRGAPRGPARRAVTARDFVGLNEHRSVEAELLAQVSNHSHCQRSAAVQYLGHATASADVRLQVLTAKPPRLHDVLQIIDRIRRRNR